MELDNKIKRAEGMLVGLVLKNPETLTDYTINKKLLSTEGIFYIGITERLLTKGVEVIDEVSFASEIESMPMLVEKYESMGGYKTVKELSAIVDTRNSDAIVEEWIKWNLVKKYQEKGILDVELHWDKLLKMNSSQLYSYLEYQLNDIDISTGCDDLNFEDLVLTDQELDDIIGGANIGLQFNGKSPILSGMSLGLPKSELNAICSYINEGKTSFAFANFVMPIVDNGHKTLIISTEQRSIVFKLMLITDVLTTKLNYWKISRKKLKSGKFTDEDLTMVKKAKEYINEHYKDSIIFLKMYDYNTEKVTKSIRKYAQKGVELVLYDVLKFGDSEDQVWKSLIEDSKNLFQACSKFNVAGLVTLQLAMATKNRVRQIGMECVSMSKAVFEVMCECYFVRSVWQDELEEDSNTYLHPYRLKRDENNKFTNEREEIKLDKNKNYKIVRLGKSRNDGTDKFVLYEVDFNFNKWKEVGLVTVSDKNKY